MAVNYNYEYRALGAYKYELFGLILDFDNPLCEHLIDLLMPTLHDERFDKIDNFIGGEYEYYTDGELERIKLPQHLFDVPFIYTTITDTRNIICIDDDISKCNQNTKEMSITIYLMCHKDSLSLSNEDRRKYKKLGYIGRNRLDIAVAILGDILNRKDIKSIGKLQPNPYNPTKSYFPNSDFFGKVLSYTASDFMIDYSKLSSDE